MKFHARDFKNGKTKGKDNFSNLGFLNLRVALETGSFAHLVKAM